MLVQMFSPQNLCYFVSRPSTASLTASPNKSWQDIRQAVFCRTVWVGFSIFVCSFIGHGTRRVYNCKKTTDFRWLWRFSRRFFYFRFQHLVQQSVWCLIYRHEKQYFGQSPFQIKSVHTVAIFTTPPGSYFRQRRPIPIYLNGVNLKSQKLLATLPFK